MSTVDIKALNNKHRELIRLHVQGLDIGRIEKALGFCEGYGSKILNSPMVQAKIEELQKGMDDFAVNGVNDARMILAEAAPMIAKNLIALSLTADKQELQASVGIKTLQFADTSKEEVKGVQQSINIYMRDPESGELKTVDIYESAFEGENGSPEGEEEREALEMIEEI